MGNLDTLGITALKAIAKAEGLKNYSVYRSANKHKLAEEIRTNRLPSAIQKLPLELHDQIGKNLSDSDKINLYRANSRMYTTLDKWYTIDELNALNQRLGPKTQITDKFRIRRVLLYPNQELPDEFKEIRGLQIKIFNPKYFIGLLFQLIASNIKIQSVTINGKVYPVVDTFDAPLPRSIPIVSISYQYTLDVSMKKIKNESVELVERFEEEDETSDFGSEEDISVMNDRMFELFKHPSNFRTSEIWSLHNRSGWNSDERGSDYEKGVPIQLPYNETAIIPAGSTLDNVINAFLMIRSHKFEDWYESFTSADVKQEQELIQIDLEFDHGS